MKRLLVGGAIALFTLNVNTYAQKILVCTDGMHIASIVQVPRYERDKMIKRLLEADDYSGVGKVCHFEEKEALSCIYIADGYNKLTNTHYKHCKTEKGWTLKSLLD